MVTPLGVTARLIVIADSTILCIVSCATVLIVTDDHSEVLVGIRGSGVDVQVELGHPLAALGNLIILGELSPPASAVVGSTDGVHIFLEAFDFLFTSLVGSFLGSDRVSL